MELFGPWGPVIVLGSILLAFASYVGVGVIGARVQWTHARAAAIFFPLLHFGILPTVIWHLTKGYNEVAWHPVAIAVLTPAAFLGLATYLFAVYAFRVRAIFALAIALVPQLWWTFTAYPIRNIIDDKMFYQASLEPLKVFDHRPDGSTVELAIPRAYFQYLGDRTTTTEASGTFGYWLDVAYPSMKPWRLSEDAAENTEQKIRLQLRVRQTSKQGDTRISAASFKRQQRAIEDGRFGPIPSPTGLAGFSSVKLMPQAIYLPSGQIDQPSFYFECARVVWCHRHPLSRDGIVFSYMMPLEQLDNWRSVEDDVRHLVESFVR